MNHAVPGTNAGYISRHKLLEDHLRSQQQAITDLMFGALGDLLKEDARLRSWLGPRATHKVITAALKNEKPALAPEPAMKRALELTP